MPRPESARQRPDRPLLTPHKPSRAGAARFGTPVAGPAPTPGAPRFSGQGGRRPPRPPRARRRARGGGGRRRWYASVLALLIVAVGAFLAFGPGRGDAALPSLRKSGPLAIPPPQSFPDQDTVRTREGRWITRYAPDEVLQTRAERWVNQYRPEGAVIIVSDLRTGQIRALVERDSNVTSSRPRLALGTTFPAASLAKIVTAAAALEGGTYRPQDDLPLLGGAHTLYKRQLRVPSHGRYHKVSLRDAFARSINPSFGLLGLRLGPEPLRDMADRLGFNRPALIRDPEHEAFPAADTVWPARLNPPDSGGYALAEIASGFTTATTLSPLHALRIARAIGHDGRLLPASFTFELESVENGRTLTLPETPVEPFASPSTLRSLRTLMEATVTSGTARRGFRRNMSAREMSTMIAGGKTGSLNGHEPPGRYEWFIGYARRKDHPDQGIAVAVMLINRTYLAVHATELAGLVIRDWLRYSAPYPDEDGNHLAGR